MKTNQSQTAPAEVRENIMGTMEINPLLLKLSIPMMISMLVQALYNVVDSVFVSHVSESALTAVSLAFSLQNVMIAVGVGTGVGVNALLSKSLGEKNQSRANATAENGIFLSLCSFAVFFVIGLTCMKPYFYAQTGDEAIAEDAIQLADAGGDPPGMTGLDLGDALCGLGRFRQARGARGGTGHLGEAAPRLTLTAAPNPAVGRPAAFAAAVRRRRSSHAHTLGGGSDIPWSTQGMRRG